MARLTFYVGPEESCEHTVGDADCQAGWCGVHGYPKDCECGGLIHADFGDEDWDGDYWLYKKCDRCGDDYEEG